MTAFFEHRLPRPRFGSDRIATEQQHGLNREHWERQVAAKKKLRRLEMMLEMKRLREAEL